MTATNDGDSGFGPRTADSLEAAGESRAPSLHCLLLAWDSGEFGKCVFDLRPVVWWPAVSGVKHAADTHRQPCQLPPCCPRALVPLLHIACAVPLMDRGH